MLSNNKPNRKPLIYYALIAMMTLFLLNALVFPSMLARQVQEV